MKTNTDFLVTRPQHDWLIKEYPHFMKTEWAKMPKRWCLAGALLRFEYDWLVVQHYLGRK